MTPRPFRTDRRSPLPVVALVLLVVVPVSALSLLAARIAGDETRSARMRFEEVLSSRLDDACLGLELRTQELGQSLARELVAVERSVSALRQLRGRLSLARELFVLSRSGELIFPPAADSSPEEQAFRQRTAAIWESAATLYEPPQRESTAVSSSRRRGPPRDLPSAAVGDSLLSLAARHGEGWLSWYWQDGLHLLFWRRAADGAVVGAEVDRVVLLSRLLASLPERLPVPGRMSLVDAKGDVIHGWGAYLPPEGRRPDAVRNLAYPLDAWRLRYHVDPRSAANPFGGSATLATGLGVAAVALALVLIAGWLWRSSTRSMREARERVSFVTQVSHELKTPLANIRLYAELLDDDLDLLEDDGPRRRLGVIVGESQRLSRLIGNILTFTKQQRGDEPRRAAEPVHVDDVVRRTVEQFTPALEAKQIEPQIDLNAPQPAFADADGLEQVLSNLIGNVEKYAASGRWMRVTTEQEGPQTRVAVEDRGPGIPRRQDDRIFEPFYRLSDRLDEGVTGTGIGLAIARTLVESWEGQLGHERPGGGTGARFVITLKTASADGREGAEERER
ncbi:MAG: HAMP domain-containing sensor histidine kinase [Myxococcota bacterium]